MRSPRTLLLPLVLGLSVAACSGAAGSSSATPTDAATSAAPTATASAGGSAATSSQAATSRVNANTATVEELQAAFEAAGISNADRWAREVAEYRPYANDPSWAQLRQELGKYNIDPTVLEQIIAVLEV